MGQSSVSVCSTVEMFFGAVQPAVTICTCRDSSESWIGGPWPRERSESHRQTEAPGMALGETQINMECVTDRGLAAGTSGGGRAHILL